MKINWNLKDKYPSVEFCFSDKAVLITYWSKLKFTKSTLYS